MLPLRDDNPSHTIPWINGLLILINLSAFVYLRVLHPHGMEAVGPRLGFIPYEFSHGIDVAPANLVPWPLTPLTAMFLHAGWLHLLGNLLYLWIFGDNVEDMMGRVRFTIFYLLAGVGAALAQVLADTGSGVPAVGASGAIAGVLGAYLLLFPQARVDTLVTWSYFARLRTMPAIVVLGFWFVLQFLNGVMAFGIGQVGGVAWFAHIGGFVIGLATVKLFVPRGTRSPTPRFGRRL